MIKGNEKFPLLLMRQLEGINHFPILHLPTSLSLTQSYSHGCHQLLRFSSMALQMYKTYRYNANGEKIASSIIYFLKTWLDGRIS